MRLWLLLAAVALATAQYSREVPKVFAPGKEYWYEYESQALTGIPAMRAQYSGLKIKARVVMHVAEDKYVTMKVSSVDVFTVPDTAAAAVEVIPTEWAPEAVLERIPTEHSNIMVDSLILPIKFRYEAGLVTKVYAEAMDPVWSVNIKRGILSMLHLDLYAAGAISEVDPIMGGRTLAPGFVDIIAPDYTTMAVKTGFKVIEPSVMGDCEAIYAIIPDKMKMGLKVAKVINLKKCLKRVTAETGMFAGLVGLAASGGAGIRGMESLGRVEAGMAGAGAGAAKEALVEPIIAADYVLSGGRHAFVIESAVVNARYGLVPAADSMVSVDGYVKQALAFLKAEPISTPIAMAAAPVLLTAGLHMTVPIAGMGWMPIGEVAEGVEVRMGVGVTAAEIEAKVLLVESLLTAIVEKTAEEVTLEVPEIVKATIAVVKTIPVEKVIELIEKVFERVTVAMDPAIVMKREILLDVIPMISSPVVPEIMVHIIKKDYVSCARAAIAVTAMSAAVIPIPEIIPTYIALIKAPEIERCMVAKKAAILGAGIVGFKIANIAAKAGVPFTEISAILKPLIKEVKMMLATPDVEIKIAVIKAIGNMGVPDFLSDIERIVKDKTAPIVIREQAIYATRKTTAMLPKVLKKILLPVHLDITEPLEVRIAAFKMAMECMPGMGAIHAIAHNLEVEPNIQVAAFVYSYLQNAARMVGCPQTRAMAMMVKKVLLITKPVRVPIMTSSKVLAWNVYLPALKAGIFHEVDMVHKAHRALPQVIVSRISAHIFGAKLGVTEIGIEMAGVDAILRKMMGPTGILMDVLMGRVDIARILDPIMAIAKGSSVEMAINEILSKVALPVADLDALKLGIYMKLFDNEVNFFALDKAAIVTVIEDVMSSGIVRNLASGIEIDITKIIPTVDNAIILPSPMGLPIKVAYAAVVAVRAKGRIALEGFSSLAAVIYEPAAVKVVADIKPSIVASHSVAVGIEHHLIKVGTIVEQVVHAVTPIKAEVIVNKAEAKIALKIFVPKTVAPRIHLKVMPMLYRHIVPVGVAAHDISMLSLHIPTFSPIMSDSIFKTVPIDIDWTIPVLGMRAVVKGERSILPPALFQLWTMNFGKQDYVIKLEAASSAPDAAVIEVVYGEREAVVKRTEGDSWWWWKNEDAEAEVVPVAAARFAEIIPDALVVAPIINKVDVIVKTVGGAAAPMMIMARVAVACSADMNVHQINAQIILPRIAPITMAETMVAADIVVHAPRLIKAILAVPMTDAAAVIAKVKVAVAPVGAAATPVVIKVMPYVFGVDPAYPFSDTIIKSAIDPVKSINVKIVADIAAVPMRVREVVIPVVRAVEAMLYFHVYEDAALAIAAEDTIVIAAQIVPAIAKINAIIALPTVTKYILGVPAPCIAPFCAPVVPAWEMKNVAVIPGLEVAGVASLIGAADAVDAYGPVSAITTGMAYGTCMVTPTHMVTMDGTMMTWPEITSGSNCDVVLAHDCSPQRMYSIIASCAPAASSEGVIIKKIKIIMPEHVIEIMKGMTHMEEVVIMVNGAVVAATAAPIRMGSGMAAVKIIKKDDMCVVHCEGLGMMVETDVAKTVVKASPMFHSSCCGMCGHMPAYKMPAMTTVSNPLIHMSAAVMPGAISMKAVVARYALASPSCPMSAAMMAPAAAGVCAVERRNIIISRVMDGVHKVCLSVAPMTVCPEFCSAAAVARESIGFHCLPATDPTIMVLVRESRERVLTELMNKVAHIYEVVPIPTACVA